MKSNKKNNDNKSVNNNKSDKIVKSGKSSKINKEFDGYAKSERLYLRVLDYVPIRLEDKRLKLFAKGILKLKSKKHIDVVEKAVNLIMSAEHRDVLPDYPISMFDQGRILLMREHRTIASTKEVVTETTFNVAINERLVKAQKLNGTDVGFIGRLHIMRDAILTEMNSIVSFCLEQKATSAYFDDESIEDLRNNYQVWLKIEYALQEIWGFEKDFKYIKFWAVPGCTCPIFDNEDMYPSENVWVDENCKLHGKGNSGKTTVQEMNQSNNKDQTNNSKKDNKGVVDSGSYVDVMAGKPRPSVDEWAVEILKATQSRATCARGRTACLFLKDDRIIASGYAGSPRGLPHCDDVGHDLVDVLVNNNESVDFILLNNLTTNLLSTNILKEDRRLIKREIEKLKVRESCVRTIHAEQNAIAWAARVGIPLDGSTCYLTMTPCYSCAKLLVQVGVRRVVILGEYKDENSNRKVKELFDEVDKIRAIRMEVFKNNSK